MDIIIRIKCNNNAPIAIHSLESGLTIYSINQETHNPSINTTIGGTHSSFSSLVNYSGGITQERQTLQVLHRMLFNYNRFGPPSIPIFPMSRKDIEAPSSSEP